MRNFNVWNYGVWAAAGIAEFAVGSPTCLWVLGMHACFVLGCLVAHLCQPQAKVVRR